MCDCIADTGTRCGPHISEALSEYRELQDQSPRSNWRKCLDFLAIERPRILELPLLCFIAMGSEHRQPRLGRLKSGLSAATLGLTVVAAGVMPAVAQEREPTDATPTVQGIVVEPATSSASAVQKPVDHRGIDWRPVLSESLLFLTAQHLTRFTEDRTVRELGGPFLKDWFDSVRSLDRFNDGGHTFTNWLAHPMMGSVTTHILGQNDPEYLANRIGSGDRYWRAKRKQFIFATVYAAQFELGPLSESSLGNIHQAGIDLVLTSSVGTALSVGEDLLAQRVLRPLRARHPIWANTLTILLNPTRSFANVMAFKRPWACEAASCY